MVGDILRREREKQGLTIKDIEQETSIRVAYLEAIEKGDYENLPGDIYTKGFIRNYGKFLELDIQALLKEYNEERNIAPVVQPVDEQGIEVASTAKESKPFASGNDYHKRMEKKSSSKKFIYMLGVIFVFLAGVYIAFSEEDTTNTNTTAVVKQEKKIEPKAAAPVPATEVSAKLNIVADSWLSVNVDGKNVFEGIARKGENLFWQGKSEILLRVGNAGGIELSWNGKQPEVLGKNGEVVERLLTLSSSGTKPEEGTASAEINRDEEIVNEVNAVDEVTEQVSLEENNKAIEQEEETSATVAPPVENKEVK